MEILERGVCVSILIEYFAAGLTKIGGVKSIDIFRGVILRIFVVSLLVYVNNQQLIFLFAYHHIFCHMVCGGHTFPSSLFVRNAGSDPSVTWYFTVLPVFCVRINSSSKSCERCQPAAWAEIFNLSPISCLVRPGLSFNINIIRCLDGEAVRFRDLFSSAEYPGG